MGGLTGGLERAFELFQRSADAGDPKATYAVGMIYEGAGGLARNPAKAIEFYRRAGELGVAEARNRLQELEQARAEAQARLHERLQQAIDSKDALATYVIGTICGQGEGEGLIPKDQKKAAEIFERAADFGSTSAMVSLGVFYMHGEAGLPKDQEKGVELFQRAADLGDADAMCNLALAYKEGVGGLTMNETKAVELYRRATELGNADAMTELGQAYAEGQGGLAKDWNRALELYRRAADLGDTTAMNYLGLAYMLGRPGLAVNYEKAIGLFQRAAEHGNVRAYYGLGVAYEKGLGVVRDMSTAKEFFRRAAASGIPGAAEKLVELEARTS